MSIFKPYTKEEKKSKLNKKISPSKHQNPESFDAELKQRADEINKFYFLGAPWQKKK